MCVSVSLLAGETPLCCCNMGLESVQERCWCDRAGSLVALYVVRIVWRGARVTVQVALCGIKKVKADVTASSLPPSQSACIQNEDVITHVHGLVR